MLYCADSIALACLETLVHLRGGGLPLNRYLVRIEIPDALWDAAERVDAAALVGWDALPAGKTSLDHGEAWVRGMRSAVMLVPSIVVPEECNVLVNPRHPGVGGITASKVRRWVYDSRTA
ncbi:RES family NAD+ phosphorylase [Chitinimonas koreensis]|nr:RES domain-containing protein [Chitinimonas koreensis]